MVDEDRNVPGGMSKEEIDDANASSAAAHANLKAKITQRAMERDRSDAELRREAQVSREENDRIEKERDRVMTEGAHAIQEHKNRQTMNTFNKSERKKQFGADRDVAKGERIQKERTGSDFFKSFSGIGSSQREGEHAHRQMTEGAIESNVASVRRKQEIEEEVERKRKATDRSFTQKPYEQQSSSFSTKLFGHALGAGKHMAHEAYGIMSAPVRDVVAGQKARGATRQNPARGFLWGGGLQPTKSGAFPRVSGKPRKTTPRKSLLASELSMFSKPFAVKKKKVTRKKRRTTTKKGSTAPRRGFLDFLW